MVRIELTTGSLMNLIKLITFGQDLSRKRENAQMKDVKDNVAT